MWKLFYECWLIKSCEVTEETFQSSLSYSFYLFIICSAHVLNTKKYVTKICMETADW